MIIDMKNSVGMRFTLSPLTTNPDRTIIRWRDRYIIVNVPIEKMTDYWTGWNRGKLIQNAFPMLSDMEREFLMTGISAEEWEKIFGKEEE